MRNIFEITGPLELEQLFLSTQTSVMSLAVGGSDRDIDRWITHNRDWLLPYLRRIGENSVFVMIAIGPRLKHPVMRDHPICELL